MYYIIDDMSRRPNAHTTFIYWLYDIRPETIAKGWAQGYPFYCGKTHTSVEYRLATHRRDARRLSHKRPVCAWVAACGFYIRPETVQIVAPGEDWSKAEQQWIRYLRSLVPICANVRDGGETRVLTKALFDAQQAERSATTKINDDMAGVEMRYWLIQMRARFAI